MESEDCDYGWCSQCHSCGVHCEDPVSHDVDWYAGPDWDADQAERGRRGRKQEQRFERACERRGWTAVRGNVLVTYALHPRWIHDSRVRGRLERVWGALPRPMAKGLRGLFRQYGQVCDFSRFRMIEVAGLPDYCVLRGDVVVLPFFTEVKYGNTKQSSVQRHRGIDLKGLGFEVHVWRGGPLPKARVQ
jgi:hypothetical protein